MGLLTQGYDLAMQHYRMITDAQNIANSMQEDVPKTDSNEGLDGLPPNTTKPPKVDSSFGDMVTEGATNIKEGQSYNVGGYNITIPALSNKKVQQIIKDENIDVIVSKASEKYDIPAALIYKVIETESYFNKNCVSSAGAMGLMQLMDFNCTQYGVTDATDPYQNIMAGTQHLREYIDRYDGDLKLGLAAYNAGPGNVDKYGGVPPFKETENYIRKILGVEP